MDTESKIMLLPESGENKNGCGLVITDFELDILGKTVKFRIGTAKGQATLADMVPLARALSTKVALVVLDRFREKGEIVPCCKDCSACCSYLIPMSVPEVFRLREELLVMPSDNSSLILQSCLDTAEVILDKGAGKLNINELIRDGLPQKEQLSSWYAGLKRPCPFLSEGLCTSYEQRPIACREHIVMGSAISCEVEETNEPEVVSMPVSILDALSWFTAELENLEIEAVMLPLALPWAQDNLDRSHNNWSAVEMVERFVEIIKTMASKDLTGQLSPIEETILNCALE